MRMKIDADRLKSMRQERAWSQDHLAQAAGLSLRTVQRIEKSGLAAFESARAIASVFGIAVADLRVPVPAVPEQHGMRLRIDLVIRLVLAAFSGYLVALHADSPLLLGEGFVDGLVLAYLLPGAVFGLCVLCPCLSVGRGSLLRGLLLVGASAGSYYLASNAYAEMAYPGVDAWYRHVPDVAGLVIASLIGMSVVMFAARLLLKSSFSGKFWWLAAGSALLGGLVMSLIGETGIAGAASEPIGFATWHVLACLVLHFGRDDRTRDFLALWLGRHAALEVHWRWTSTLHTSIAQSLRPLASLRQH